MSRCQTVDVETTAKPAKIPAKMPAFVEKYTDAQRDAAAHAYEDRGIRPYSRVSQLAAAGELTHNGQKLDPFEMPPNTVADLVRKLRRRRRGEQTSQLAQQPPRDALEALRRRLINLADRELAHEEKRKPGDVEPEKLRQLVRVARELAALPGPGDPRPTAPGQRKDGERNGAETKGGLAGKLLSSHRATATGSPEAQTVPRTHEETHSDTREHSNAQSAAHTTSDSSTNSDQTTGPGSRVAELVERVELGLAGAP